MKMTTTLMSVVAGMGLAAAGIPQAQAAPILSWGYTLEAGFENVLPATGITPIGNSGVDLGDPTKLEWGVSSKSSLVLNPEPLDPLTPTDPNRLSGTIATTFGSPVIWADGTRIAHNNFVIDGTSLDSATIMDQFNLDSIAPPGGSNVRRNPFFLVNFMETNNFPETNPPCPAPSGNGTGCKDIFVLDLLASALSTEIIDGSLAIIIDNFLIDDYFYKVALRSNPDSRYTQLEVLTDDQCAAAGALVNCVGTTTFENANNIMALQFTVLANKVPEPGVLALFGIGLAGLGFARSRKENSMKVSWQ